MPKSVRRRNVKKTRNLQKKTRNQKKCGGYKKRQSIKKNRATKSRSKSKSRSRSIKRSCQMGGSPAYTFHVEKGFLNRINKSSNNLPITYYENADINSVSNLYKVSV